MRLLFRASNIIIVISMVVIAAFTYRTKHEVEDILRNIGKLEKQIEIEKDTIDILNAEWSLLTQPGRLQSLAKNYNQELRLHAIRATQIVNLEDIANKVPPLKQEDGLKEALDILGFNLGKNE